MIQIVLLSSKMNILSRTSSIMIIINNKLTTTSIKVHID